jgi:hypothetical protein
MPWSHSTRLSRAMRGGAVAALGLVAVLLPREGGATGVLAIGQVGGFTFAIAANSPDVDSASQRALTLCRNTPDALKTPALRADCKVITTFVDKCAVMAWDPAPNWPGVGIGWSIAADLETAKREAISKCETTVAPGRGGTCVVSRSQCDGKAQ